MASKNSKQKSSKVTKPVRKVSSKPASVNKISKLKAKPKPAAKAKVQAKVVKKSVKKDDKKLVKSRVGSTSAVLLHKGLPSSLH